MEIYNLIDETIKKLNIKKAYLCYGEQYKSVYEKLIIGECKSPVEVLRVDNLTCEELKSYFDTLGKNDLIILIFPFHFSGSDGGSKHNYLMGLEKKGIYFINISAGVEGVNLTHKTQELYNKLLFQIIEHSSQKSVAEKSKYYIDRLINGKKVRITDELGSNIEFIIELALEDIIPLTPDRRVVQIPYGEVFVVPKRGSVNGKFVHKRRKGNYVYEIKDDFVTLDTPYYQGSYPICEIGFGTNWLIPSINALPYLEKKYPTYHLGFGDNSNFGGSHQYSFHFDEVQDKVNWKMEILDE